LRDIQLSPSMITFTNLDELLRAIDESIDQHMRAIERYSDLLGGMLRETIGNGPVNYHGDSKPRQEQKKGGGGFGQIFSKQQPPNDNKKMPKGKLEEEQKGWSILEAEDFSLKIATGQASQVNSKRTESLFKIVEALKAKVAQLQTAKKFLEELPSRGLRPNQIMYVVFKDGIPKQILPSNESRDERGKFTFEASFAIEPMRAR
jgi:hypothetical protein